MVIKMSTPDESWLSIDSCWTADTLSTRDLKQPAVEGEQYNVKIVTSITDATCLFLYAFLDIVNPISAV